MINLYNSNNVDFNNNGIGNLKDMINCFVTEELNGIFEFEAEYPLSSNYIEQIKNENILKLDIGNNDKQLFRIKKTTPNLKTLKIYGQHITYDLKDNNLDDVYPRNQNCNNMGQWILNRTQYEHNFTFFSDIEKIATARYVDVNPLKAIMGEQYNSFLNLFGGEIVRDNFTIKLLQNRGINNGYKLSKTKNITGLEITEDNSSIATRLIPKAYDGIKLPEKYIDSPLINNYPHPYIQEIEFSDVKLKSEESPDDEEAFDTLEELYEELRRRCYEKFNVENIDKPLINVKVNFVELSKIDQYAKFKNMETLKLGDYVTLITDNFNITLQVIKTKYNVLLKRYTEIELGTKKINFVSSTTRNMDNIMTKVDDIDPVSILNQARANATNQITSALGGYTYKTHNEFFIMDTDDPNTAQKVWRWNLNGLGYSKNGINGPYELAMTQDGKIVADFIATGELNTNVIRGYDSLLTTVSNNTQAIGDRSSKSSTITQDIDRIEMEISDIADITTSASTEEAFIDSSKLQNINESEPIRIEIRPIEENISYLYPNSNLYPSSNLFLKVRTIRFINTLTNQVFDYNIPFDLLYYDSDNYDEFIIDYEAYNCTFIKRCKYKSDGTVELLEEPIITTLDYPSNLGLTNGNYTVQLLGYEKAYLFVRLMVVNAYTSQYPTRFEMRSSISQSKEEISLEVERTYATKNELGEVEISLSSSITQTADSINLEVNKKLNSSEFVGANIILKINDEGSQAQINADKISLEGKVINLTSDNIVIRSNNFSVDKYGNVSCNNAVLSGTFKNYSNSGKLAVEIASTNINFYDYQGSGALAGTLASVRGTSDNTIGINLFTYSGNRLTLGYKESSSSSTIYSLMQFDTSKPNSTPWVKNTVSGELFASAGGIVVENGFIKSWNLHTISTQVTIGAYKLIFENGLLTDLKAV